MKSKLSKKRCLLLAMMSAGFMMGVGEVHAEKAGPLPQLKVNKAKAELGKRLFFDKRLSSRY